MSLITTFAEHLCFRFPHVIQRSVAKLKKEGFIKEHVDVTRNILSYTDLPEELYPLPRETRDSKYSRSKFDKQQVTVQYR